MGPTTVDCPVCDVDVPMGFPYDAEIGGIATDPEELPPAEGSRRKRRENVCDNGHRFYVHFEF